MTKTEMKHKKKGNKVKIQPTGKQKTTAYREAQYNSQ